VGTVVQYPHRGTEERHQRWERLERAELWEPYVARPAQGSSQRQAATLLAVPRSTLQAWRVYQEHRDAPPTVGAFFPCPPGLACLHRLVLALHLVGVAGGACGMRRGCRR
jgi:hypothetical protein